MVAIADNFLKGNDSFADPIRSDAHSSYSKTSKATDKSRIHSNIAGASKYNPLKIKLLQDRLNDTEKQRLNSLLQEIEDNLDDLMKEKQEYHRQQLKGDTRSTVSRLTAENAYSYGLADQRRMSEINEQLQRFNPSLIGS